MEWSEIIGFLIMIFIIMLPIFRQMMQEKSRQKAPTREQDYSEGSKKQEQVIEDFLQSLDLEFQDEILEAAPAPIKPPPPPPKPIVEETAAMRERRREEKFAFKGKVEDRHRPSRIENRKVETQHVGEKMEDRHLKSGLQRKKTRTAYLLKSKKGSVIKALLQEPDTRRNMILLYEVLSPAKGLRHNERI